MSRLHCSDPSCERTGIRRRDDQWWCLFHPESQPPVIDPKTGKILSPTTPVTRTPRTPATPRPTGYRAPGRVVVEAGGPCPTEGCTRPARHGGWHTRPKPAVPPAGTPCLTDGCVREIRHRGPHSYPKPQRTPRPATVRSTRPGRPAAVIDPIDAARRYQQGEPLFKLAADLHIGAQRLREILRQQGVTLRGRGQVITRQPAPVDWDEVRRRYADGATTTQIARHFHTHASRISDQLRTDGLLRRGGTPSGDDADIRLKLQPGEAATVRAWATQQDLTVTEYLRRLIRADLLQPRQEGAA